MAIHDRIDLLFLVTATCLAINPGYNITDQSMGLKHGDYDIVEFDLVQDNKVRLSNFQRVGPPEQNLYFTIYHPCTLL